jgi:N-acetyl-anhydromuramyl-L-alanine amidase AmpD
MTGKLSYPFVPAAASNYATGRQGYQPIWVVLHCTDAPYQDNYPANLAKYWAGNNTQVSVHFGVSDTMVYQYVSMDDTAFQTRNPGNLRGIGMELAGLSSWSRNEWMAHKLMMRRAAQLVAEITLAYGLKTQPQLLTKAQLVARQSGLTCHHDLTEAFAGTHTDPGPNFPWDFFYSELKIALAGVDEERNRITVMNAVAASTSAPGGTASGTAPGGGSDALMSVSEADWTALKAQVARLNQQSDRTDAILSGGGQGYTDSNLAKQLGYVLATLGKKVDDLAAKVDALSKPGS